MADLARRNLGLGARPALLLVDLICGFTDPACALGSACEDVVTANARLLSAFRTAALPVLYTTVVYRSDDQARVFRQRVPALNLLTPDSKWIEVDAMLAPCVGEPVIEKRWASAFFGTDLDLRLRAAAVDSLVVTGLTTSGCVRATVVDAMQHEYPVVVPREAVGDRNAQAQTANLFDLHAKYADVQALDEVIEAVMRLARRGELQ